MKDLRDDLSRFELLAGIGAENSGLSSLDLKHFCGVDIGIRNFKRDMPLETEAVNGVKVPAKAEMCRIKAVSYTHLDVYKRQVKYIPTLRVKKRPYYRIINIKIKYLGAPEVMFNN